ncbi:MAG: alpha/beta hydrolase [bacterium]|nr:alpha/beta hydrolase [bacterium]
MQKRVFLIHGWEGKPNGNWFPYLSLELKANGFEVNAPQMPHADQPKVSEWLAFLKDYVGKPDKDTYFVGHSLGCIAIARYLETLPAKTKIGGAVFVAGFSGRINVPEIAEFYSLPFNPEKAKQHSDNFVMIFSDTDPYVPMEKSLEMAKQFGAKTILERGKGHFTAHENVATLPVALTELLRISHNDLC